MWKPFVTVLLSFVALLTGVLAYLPTKPVAAADPTINFQARLENTSGAIAPDGNYNVEFKIYTASSGGTANWTEDWLVGGSTSIRVANGYLTASLGTNNPFSAASTPIPWGQPLWITMNIGGTGGSPSWDGEMTPRLGLTAVPTALSLTGGSGSNTASLGFASSFGQATQITLPDPGSSTANVCYQNDSACGFVTGSSGSFIQNSLTQQTANFNIIGNNTGNPTALIQGIASGTKPVLQLRGGSTPGAGEDLLSIQDSPGTTTFFKIDNAGNVTANNSLSVVQANASTATNITSSSTGDGADVNLTNTIGTQTNGLFVNRNGASGTTTNGINITNTAGTLTNGVSFSGTIGTDINRASGILSLQGAGGVTITAGTTTAVTLDSAGNGTINLGNTHATTVQIGNSATTTTVTGALTAAGGAVQLNASSNNNTSINTGTSTGSVSIGNSVAGALSLQSSTTLAVTTSNFNLSTAGVVTLAGAQAVDITTAGAATANAITLQPGTSSGASSNGPALNLNGGNASGTTSVTGGNVNLQGGNATGGSGTRNGGSVFIDSGTGSAFASNGSITIGGSNATTVSLGSTTQNSGTQTINVGNNNTAGSTTNVTVGSGSSATGGTTTVQAKGAVTITAGAASTFSTTAGLLTIQGAGGLSLGVASQTTTILGGNSSTFVVGSGGNTTTLNFTTPSGANTITFPAASGTVQLTPASGSYIQQVPTGTINTITPTANTVIGLTVNATSGTSAVAAVFNQANNTSPADTVQINTTNTAGTQTNGLIFNRNGAGGTTTNGINVTNTAGTLTNAISINQTGGTLTTGVLFNGTLGGDGIQFTGTTVQDIANTGSNALTLFGANGVTVTAASGKTISIDDNTAGTGTVSIGAANAATINVGNGSSTTTNIFGGTAINIGTTGAAAQTITLGLTTQTGLTTIGQSTATNTIAIGNANLTANTQTINIGAGATGSGTDAVTIGSNTATSTTALNGTLSLNASVNLNTSINTGTSTGTVSIGNGAAGALSLQSGSTIAIATTNFNVSTAGVVTLAGAQTRDITTVGASTATAITLQPGTSSGASSNGPALSLNGGDASGTTNVTGGNVNLQGGNATGASGTRNGGSVFIDAGTGSAFASNGSITIGGSNATTISLGSTTQNSGTQTINVGNNNTAGSTTNVTIGSGSSATGGVTTVQAKGAVTITAGAASTFSTTAGLLTVQGAGGLSLGLGTQTTSILGGNSTSIVVGTGGNTTTLAFTAPSGNKTITFPAETGTVCTSAATSPTNCANFAPATAGTGYIQNQSATPQTANFNIIGTGTTVPAAKITQVAAGAGGGIGLLVVGAASPGDSVFEVDANGGGQLLTVQSGPSRVSLGSTGVGGLCNGAGAGRFCIGQATTSTAGAAIILNTYNAQTLDNSNTVGNFDLQSQKIVVSDTSGLSGNKIEGIIIDTTGTNTGTTTVNSVKVNVTSTAQPGNFLQLQANSSDVFDVGNNATLTQTVAATGTSAQTINLTNGSGTGTNAILINRNTASGTTTNGINIAVANGTLTNGININQSSSGSLVTGILLSGTATGDGIQFTGTTVQDIANTGSNALTLFGTNGVTVTAASGKTISLDDNTSSSGTVNIGATNAATVAVGNSGSATTVAGNTISLSGNTTVATNKSFTANGTALFQDATNAATAFRIQNALGSNVLLADTTPLNTLIDNGNGSFEGTVTLGSPGWALKGTSTGTVARDTTQQYIGAASLKVALTSTGNTDGVKYTPSTFNTGTYQLSFWIKQTAGTDFTTNLAFGYNNGSDQSCTPVPSLSSQSVTATMTGWVRFNCTFTTSGTPSFLYWKETDTPGAARTFFLDGVQLESTANAYAQPFTDSKLQLNGVITSPVILQNANDSTAAFQILNNAGSASVLTADTLNNRVEIGAANQSLISTSSNFAQLFVNNTVAAQKGLVVAAASGQSKDILDVVDSSGNFLSGFGTTGNLTVNSSITIGNSSQGTLLLRDANAHNLSITTVANINNARTIQLDTSGLSGNRAYTFPDASGTLTLNPASGAYLQQVPTGTINTVSPTANTVVGLTVNATSGTSAVAALFGQANNTSTADTVEIDTTTTANSQTNALLINRNGTGGTTTNGINITNTLGTLTNGLAFTGTIANADIYRSAGVLTEQGTGGVTITAGTTNAATIDSAGAGSVLLGNTNATTVTLGNGNATTTSIQGGTAINIGTATAGQTITLGSTTQTGTMTFGQSTATNIINIGSANPSTTNTQTINIGNGGGQSTANTIAVNILSGAAGSNGTAALKLANNDRVTQVDVGNVVADAARSLNLFTGDSSAVDTINIGTGNTSAAGGKTIHIGDGTPTGTNLITIGSNANVASTTAIQGGNGTAAISLTPQTTGTIVIGAAAGTGNITVGSSSGTQTVLIGNGAGISTVSLGNATTAGSTVNIAGAATATGITDTVNIATGNTAGTGAKVVHIADGSPAGTNTVTIGSIAATANVTTIQGGNGATAINLAAAASGNINIGTNAVTGKVVNIGSVSNTANASTINIATTTDNTTAQAVTIGSAANNTGNITVIQGGSNITQAIQLVPHAAGGILIGAAVGTGTITIGQSTATNTISIGAGATSNNFVQTIDIGNGADTSTGKAVVTVGNINNASSLTLQAGTGNIAFNTGGVVRATFDNANSLYLGNGVTAAAPSDFTLQGSGSATTAVRGGAVAIQGGSATVGNANGGNITLSGGGGLGTGISGIVIINQPTLATAGSQSCGSNCTVTQASVDGYGAVIINATAASLTATLPDPGNATAGRLVYVTAANGSNDFTLSVNGGGTGNQIAMRQNTTATMIWNGSDWTAAGASSSTTLQAAYNNTLTSAGGAELLVSNGANANGLTIRDDSSNPINGTLLEVQSATAATLFSVSDNVTDYASDGGAETAGASSSTFPASTWAAIGSGPTVSRYTTAGNNIASGAASVSTVTNTTANTGVADTLSTTLTANQFYNVSFAVRLATGGTFTDLEVDFSKDGTNTSSVACASAQTVKTSAWTKVNCTFAASSSGITSSNAILIRQTSGVAHTFYVDNFSITLAGDHNYATDSGVDDNTNFAANWGSSVGLGTVSVTRNTLDGNDASDSASADVTAGAANAGLRNKLSINPLTSTLYRVSVYAKLSTGAAFTDFKVRYSRDAGTNFVDCVDYNTQTVVTTGWTQITCYITTDSTAPSGSGPYVYFVEAASNVRKYLVDTFSMTISGGTTPDVQIGGGVNGGPVTLFTLDRSASAPIAANNDAFLGSMYYDTTLGKLQCYESDGWGACGSSPDNIITISPEYTNAVLHGTGVGTLTSDICSDFLDINDATHGTPVCGTNETFNFYRWTSPQATAQTYSVYVTYQLPSTFKSFTSGSTSLMGLTDSANSTVAYSVYKNHTGSALALCGSATVSTGVQTSWQVKTATGTADPSTCGFVGGDSIIFKIDVTASSNANAYVSNLNFTFSNK